MDSDLLLLISMVSFAYIKNNNGVDRGPNLMHL